MEEEEEEDWDAILSRARAAITAHPDFNNWRGEFSEHTRQIIDDLLDHNVTLEMIERADSAPREEWDHHMFLRALTGGNCDPAIANDLTDVVLDFLFIEFSSPLPGRWNVPTKV
jgi:hypothetical protein